MVKTFKTKCEFCGHRGFTHSRKRLISSRMKELKNKYCSLCKTKGGLYIIDEIF